MAKEKINVLYTVDDKEFPSKDYMNALEKMETLSKEYEELKRVEGKQDQREEKSQLSKIYAKWHTLFKNNCLAPFPKRKEKKTVFIKWLDMSTLVDQGDAEDEIHLTVMTPEMLLTDYLFYARNVEWGEYRYDAPDSWGKGMDRLYKPYYYAFDQYEIESVNDSLLQKLKEKDIFGYKWFQATIWLENEDAEKSSISDRMLRGRLCFSASKYEAEAIIMEVAEKVADTDLLKALKAIDDFPDKSKFDTRVTSYISKVMGNIEPGSSVKIYNMGQANCLYVYLYLQGQERKFFFDVGRPFDTIKPKNSTPYPNPDLDKNTVMSKNLIRIGLCKPDVIFLSHWHTDHVLGSMSLGRYAYEDSNDCKWIVPWPNNFALERYRRLIKFLMIKKKIKFIDQKNVKNGIVASKDDVTLYQGQGKDLNASSLMLRLKNTLLAGDCMYQYWPSDLLQDIDDIEQMVIPHHGSELKPNDEAIINNTVKLSRQTAVICTGENGYTHPNQTHINDLKKILKFSSVQNLKNMKNVDWVIMDIS